MAASSTPKSASTRLLTMKFMQRAAVSASSTSPITPKSDGENSSKRRKVSHAEAKSSATDQLFDQAAIQAALDEEERKRQAAIEKQALELGDSRWVLDVQAPVSGTGQRPKQPLNIVQVGFAQIDGLGGQDENGDQGDELKASGQHNFRRFNMKKVQNSNKEPPSSAKSSDDDSNDASSPHAGDEQDGSRGRRNTSSKERRSPGSSLQRKKSGERTRAQEFAEKRRKKEVKLNKLTSISSAGSGAFRSPVASPKIVCHRCKQPGHKIANCPKER